MQFTHSCYFRAFALPRGKARRNSWEVSELGRLSTRVLDRVHGTPAQDVTIELHVLDADCPSAQAVVWIVD